MLEILTFFFISTTLSAQEDFGQDPLYSATIRADIEGIKKPWLTARHPLSLAGSSDPEITGILKAAGAK